jgi:hypothetical protein
MRQLIFGAIAASTAVFLLAGFTPPNPFGTPPDLASIAMTVKAQQVIVSPRLSSTSPRMMRGKFEIRAARPGDKKKLTQATTGGACLLTQFEGLPKTCTQPTECSYLGPEQSPAGGRKKWVGYCLRDHDSLGAELPTNSCWVKPSEDYCLKGVTAGEHRTPSVDTRVVFSEAAKHSPGPVRWIVLGRLNSTGPDPYMLDNGPVRPVPQK